MEEIEEFVITTENKISKFNDFIALSLRRNNISKELEKLIVEVIEVRDKLAEAHKLIQQEFDNSRNEYEEIMSQMRKKQLIVVGYVISEKQRKIREAEDEKAIFSCGKSNINQIKAPSSTIKNLTSNFNLLKLNHPGHITPKIKITEYKESPLVKKKVNIIDFQFEEFDVKITQQKFDTIPKYMCGRETLDQLNSFLEMVIIPCFNEKYKLLHKERSCLRNLNDLELWRLYNDQASLLPGRAFITPGDLTRKLNKMLDKKTHNRLVMLRHIGILNEIRINQTVCFAWVANIHQSIK